MCKIKNFGSYFYMILALMPIFISAGKPIQKEYKCVPCGYDCDEAVYTQPGTCSHCNMKLVDANTIRFNQIQPTAVCNFTTTNKEYILLDVRTPEEFSGTAPEKFGRLKGAINIPVQELEKRLQELKAYKNKPVLVYCSHSHRSPMASYTLNQHGFNKVTNMSGGMSVWQEHVKNEVCLKRLYVKQ
jgi:rhodanese-related sulfurtransferase/DNA-directed RNA polymerase subunit RPC12/RpoP